MCTLSKAYDLLDAVGIGREAYSSLSTELKNFVRGKAMDVYYSNMPLDAEEIIRMVRPNTSIAPAALIEENKSADELRKYERFVEEIELFFKNSGEQEMHGILSLIYDYEKCNDYAKVIMEKSTFPMQPSDDGFKDLGEDVFLGGTGFTDDGENLRAVKQFAQSCIQSGYYETGCRFIFWALMVLTVDESDAKKHLDLICNLAEMLCVTDDEFEDIVQLVKAAYSEAAPEYEFKSEKIPVFFSRFIEACGWEIRETVA